MPLAGAAAAPRFLAPPLHLPLGTALHHTPAPNRAPGVCCATGRPPDRSVPHPTMPAWPPRTPQNAKNVLREGALARFLDLVVWGHEHECIEEPWESVEAAGAFSVMQPGSSGACLAWPAGLPAALGRQRA